MGGKRGLGLADNGSIDTFLDYTFANKANCNIVSIATKQVKVAVGGYLETDAVTEPTAYTI
jgi:hypothetical protein